MLGLCFSLSGWLGSGALVARPLRSFRTSLRSPMISPEKAPSSAPPTSSQPPLGKDPPGFPPRAFFSGGSCLDPCAQRPGYMLAFLCPCMEGLASLGGARGQACLWAPPPLPQPLVSCSSPGSLLPPLQDSAGSLPGSHQAQPFLARCWVPSFGNTPLPRISSSPSSCPALHRPWQGLQGMPLPGRISRTEPRLLQRPPGRLPSHLTGQPFSPLETWGLQFPEFYSQQGFWESKSLFFK